MYLYSKDLTGGLESISEIAFKLLGRISIFMMSTVLLLLCMGCLVIYFNLFAKICVGLYDDFGGSHNDNQFTGDRRFYILIVGAVNMLPIYMKEIREMKFISVMLFASITTLAIVMIIYLSTEGAFPIPEGVSYWSFKVDNKTVTALSVFIFSYMFQLTLF